ncbi:Glycosyltransferase involved in cell wall bisynthesis [Actinopolyspora xinjiangensis]|uniref:Glycosyltransferase involved in cell wall bisynthesis n=1 Tax=Actinopolyspora xinjiangensis TaxID=405564 RepID=A0A1H0NYD4_9ACTN|nr:glycosyltransferase [Actinopolyspora xinjiangensis]SDO97639.1 Glycosyltransferase involved in cell wall bisynthesis [Actinopolyspora xinjiangensis]
MTSQLSGRPLRIVLGAVMYPPDVNGAASFAHRLATGLAARGHEVHVICHAPERRSCTATEDGVTVHRVGSYGTPLHPTTRVCPPWRASSEAKRLLREIRPDVVHVQSHFFIGRGLINAAKKAGIPLVATNHFMPENIFGYLRIPRFLQSTAAAVLWRNLVRHYSKAATVTAPTPRAVRLLQEHGFTKRALPISCGIDIDRYRSAAAEYREQHPDPAVRNVLFVGRLDEEKHIDDLLRAMSLLHTDAPTRLEIIGEGSRRAALEQLAGELGIADRVRFAGLVDEEELLAAYARADVFCMPSIAELQSLATMEAMSARTAVVLANAMALPHLVRPGRNGWLYPPRDVHALAKAIDEVVTERATVDAMGAFSQHIIAEAHDIEAVLTRFESVYHHLIDPGRADDPVEIHTELAG